MGSPQKPTPESLPAVRPWLARAGAAPYVPGKPTEIIGNLTALLQSVADDPKLENAFAWPSTEKATSLREAVRHLGACGLLRREQRPMEIVLTEDAWHFLSSGDDFYLVSLFHANVRFMGEVLACLGEGIKHAELNGIAARDYGLQWDTLDPVRRRVYWLRAAGLADYWSNGKIVLTERGREFLNRIELVSPNELPHRRKDSEQEVDLPQPPMLLGARLSETGQPELRSRKNPIGYVAGGVRVETVTRLVNAAVPDIIRSDFIGFCVDEFGVIASSAEHTLNTLRALGLLVQVGTDTFAATELAANCLTSCEPLDFIRLLHLNVALVGETLDAFEQATPTRALVGTLSQRYPDVRVTREFVTRRVGLFLETGLAERIGNTVRRTELGTALVRTLPLLDSDAGEDVSTGITQSGPDRQLATATRDDRKHDLTLVAGEVMEAATDSTDYQRFERAVVTAFRTLGVEVEVHSGPKKTDAVIMIWQSPQSRLRIAVEAKTDGAGLVTDQDVKFWRLGEHRKRHEAQGTVLVGPRFDVRVVQEATKDKVVVLTAQELAHAVLRHGRTPLMPYEIAALVAVEERDALESTWQTAERRQVALAQVLEAMWKSGNDPVDIEYSAGALGVREIWRETKGVLETPLDPSEIREALTFLEAPFVAGVAQHGVDHVVTAPPTLIAARLRALAVAIESSSSSNAAGFPDIVERPAIRTTASSEAPEQLMDETIPATTPSLVRAWATAQGKPVSERGRLPTKLVMEYKRVHGLLEG